MMWSLYEPQYKYELFHINFTSIREERAEISQAALIKLVFRIYKSNKLKARERAFEEEGLIFNLRIKRRSLTKYKAYPFNLENVESIVCMEAKFQSDFLKTQASLQKPKSGKWNMDLAWNRMRFDFDNWWRITTIPFSSQVLSRSSVRKWRWCHCF